MNPSPILKALSSMRQNGVRALLMGGQACVFYGAAEFSRDLDLLVPLDPELGGAAAWLRQAQAEVIAVPPLESALLARGHAVHFRCRAEGVAGLRVDVMARLRGVAEFEELWSRHTEIVTAGGAVALLSLPDLVAAKKTQRDKDWPMVRRLMERAFLEGDGDDEFFLRELRTPSLLIESARRAPEAAAPWSQRRPAVAAAVRRDGAAVEAALNEEEQTERTADRAYWAPLRRELEALRHAR